MTRDRMQALKYSNDDVDAVSRLVYLHLRFHTYAHGLDRLAPCAGSCATPATCSRRADRADPLRLHHPQRAQGRARWRRRMDELEERIAELQAQEELRGDPPRPRRQPGDGPPRPRRRGATSVRRSTFLLELRLDEGPLGEEEAYRRLDAWWADRQAGSR